MKLHLSLDVLADELSVYYPDLIVHTIGNTNLKLAARFDPNMTHFRTNCLYIGRPADYTSVEEQDCCFLLTEAPADENEADRYLYRNYILITEVINIDRLFMQIQGILLRIWSWYAQILEISAESDDLERLMTASTAVLPENFYYHSIYHNTFIHSSPKHRMDTSKWDNLFEAYYLAGFSSVDYPLDYVTDAHSIKKPSLITMIGANERVLMNNVFLNDIRMGTFVLSGENVSFRNNHYYFLEILSYYTKIMLKRITQPDPNSLHYAIEKLLYNEEISFRQLESLCKKSDWQMEGNTLRMLVIYPNTSYKEKFLTDMLLYRNISSHLCGKSIILPFKNEIVILRDFTDNVNFDKNSETQKHFFTFLKNIHASVGMSIPFSRMTDVRIFYEQARAIAINQPSVTHFSLTSHAAQPHEYSYYLLCDLIRNFAHSHSLEHYIHPEITAIAEEDNSGDNHLLLSLYYYLLNDRSYHQCSEKLFIHRNTFAYRIKKVLSLLETDIHDENNRLSLLLSICMYWYLHPEQDPIGISNWNKNSDK